MSVSNKSNARGRRYEKADVRLNALLERRRELRSILRSTEGNAEVWIISYQEKVLTAVTLYGISKKQDTYAGEPIACDIFYKICST